jgi:hypothetical protein
MCERKFKIMLPRRHAERVVENPTMEWEMRKLHAILDSMEIVQRREIGVGYISEAKSEEMEVEGDVAEECLLKVIVKMGVREKMEVLMYEGNLDVEELLDWITDLYKYFNYEEIQDENNVNHVVTRLKGHATLWWDELQADRRHTGKKKIKIWDRMVAKLKVKFIFKHYQISMFRTLSNLGQKGLSMKEYIEEFYRLKIKAGHRQSDEENVARYINGQRYEIQEEFSMMKMRMVEYVYQVALKAKENFPERKANEKKERVQEEAKELSKKSSRSLNLKPKSITIIQKEEEVPWVENMVAETLFLEEEEEEEK